MKSLNDLVEDQIESRRRSFVLVDIESELDQNIPQVYDRESQREIRIALGQLAMEWEDAIKGIEPGQTCKVLYKTKLEGDQQTIEIYHNGNRVPADVLQRLNHDLDEIAQGRLIWKPDKPGDIYDYRSRSGNRIAAQVIHSYNGRMQIENVSYGGYNVVTRIQIPLDGNPRRRDKKTS